MSASTSTEPVDPSVVAALRADFAGEIVTPGDEAYDHARRVWNGMIDRRPAVIARCASRRDIAAAVALSRDQGLPLAVRGGGHSAAGFGVCDRGIVVDLSLMRAVRIDPAARRASVGGGATWVDVDRAAQAHGLAVTGGLVTHTGVGGLTLGGGLGNLMRRCGLTCDNLVAADLICADGERVAVSEQERPDLLWGLRGGGGNFGVVTRFEFSLHDVGPTVLAGAAVYPLADAPATLRFYRDWAASLPDDMTTVVALRSAPPAPFLPSKIHGEPVLMIAACWAGALDAGEKALEPLRRATRPLVDLIGPKPYLHHQSMFDASAPHGRWNYKRNANLPGLADAVIDALVEHTAAKTSPHSMTVLFQLGGAVSRIDEYDTAYSDRDAAFNVDLNAQWIDAEDSRAEEHVRWVRDLHAAVLPFSTGGAYVNFLNGDEDGDRVRAAYGVTKFERLVELKRRYDPDNVFCLNQNVRP